MASNPATGVPQGAPIAEVSDLRPTPIWAQFFLQLWERTGGAEGTPSIILDAISNSLGSMLVRGITAWQGLNAGPEFSVLRMGASLPEWSQIDGDSFNVQAPATFFAGPDSGADAVPTFRIIEFEDLPPGEYPGTTVGGDAVTGNVGEELSVAVAPAAAVALASGTIANIAALALTAGDWDVWASIGITAGVTSASGWVNAASLTNPGAPNNGCYATWGAGMLVIPLGMMRVPTNGETVFLSTVATFTGSVSAYGFLGARRRR